MNIITVIPLSKSKVAPELSYFTSSEVPVGAVVTVPLRRKTIHAIVTASANAMDLKIDIKNAPFVVRKLGKIKATVFFPSSFVLACNYLAQYYATTVGAVIHNLVSDSILENIDSIAPPLPRQSSFGTTTVTNSNGASSKEVTYAIQGDDADRFSSWRSLIRQEFARKRSIAIYAATIEDCQNIFDSLVKGIEGYIFMLNSNLSKKKFIQVWTDIADTDHPVIVVATGFFPILPRGDIDTVIIERENGRGWKSQRAPYIDIRHALEVVSHERKQTIFIADSMLSNETLHRLDNEVIEQGSPFKWRSISTARDALVDMKEHKGLESQFRVISPELENLITTNRDESAHLFILTLRRGHSPMTVCDECETIVVCSDCSSPVVLHTSTQSGKNFFMCHKCGARRSADETCANCHSWRLTPLGIGIERVRDEIHTKFPEVDIFLIDKESTKSEKQIRETIEKFRAKPGSILLGTETAMLHLTEKIDHVAVASLDSLFALPDFRIQEKIMYMIIRLRNLATKMIMIQTRKSEEKVFEYSLKGNLSDYYRTSIIDRKQFLYPPFSVLIKITIEGKKDTISSQMADIQTIMNPTEIDVFPAFTATVKNNSIIHGLIKVESHTWPDPILVAKLRALPPGVTVKINPDSLL